MRHFEKRSREEGSPIIVNHGAFFLRDLYTIGKLWTKLQPYRFFFPEIIQFDRTIMLMVVHTCDELVLWGVGPILRNDYVV